MTNAFILDYKFSIIPRFKSKAVETNCMRAYSRGFHLYQNVLNSHVLNLTFLLSASKDFFVSENLLHIGFVPYERSGENHKGRRLISNGEKC